MSEPHPSRAPNLDVEQVEEASGRGAFNSDEARYTGAEAEAALAPASTESSPDAEAERRLAAYDGGYGGQEFGVEAGGDETSGQG